MTIKTMTAPAARETKTFGPKLKTALPGPNAKRILAGDEVFDFSAGIAVTSTGHCHPDVVAASQKQAGELIHMSGTDFYYENMVQLAERLSKIAPMPGPHKIYYGNSGAEAIECALKLARYHTRR